MDTNFEKLNTYLSIYRELFPKAPIHTLKILIKTSWSDSIQKLFVSDDTEKKPHTNVGCDVLYFTLKTY